MNTLLRDVLYAFRMIVKTPVVTGIAIVSLAIGVAANTTIFSILNSWLLRPLPYPEADRMVMVWENELSEASDFEAVTPANFLDWKQQSTSFDALIAADFTTANLTSVDRPEQLTVADVTPNFFSLLGASPILGRTFLESEGGDEDAPVAVLSETLWRNRFGARSDILNTILTLDGSSVTVVGVMPETFDFLVGSVNLWQATDFENRRDDRTDHTLVVTARLKPGIVPSQAQSEMTAVASRLKELYPETNTNYGVNIETLREAFPGTTDRALIQLLMAVVSLVLVIACVNVAGLLMAKTDARHKEIAVRVALGAGKGRLVRQLMTESIVLALMAGALGTVLSMWGVASLVRALPSEIPGIFMPQFDSTVVAFSMGVSLLAGLTFGITPAVQAVGGKLRSALVETSRGGTATKGKRRVRNAFVMVEFALALTILIGAAVLTDLFHQRLDIDPGFDVTNLLTVELTLPEHKYEDDASKIAFTEELHRKISNVSGSSGLALMSTLPRSRGVPSTEFAIDGRLIDEDSKPNTAWLSVDLNYFNTMGISLRSGRSFSNADRADAPPVVIVNQRMVDQFFEGNSPVGERITIQETSREIVGVTNNIALQRLSGLQPTLSVVYFPIAQRPVQRIFMAIRANGDPHVLAAPVQEAVWEIDSDQPITSVTTMEEHFKSMLAGPNFMAAILVIVGLLALGLAAVGIYGVMSYSVSQRTNELGIRMALGASPRQVLAKVASQGITLAGVGLLMGVPGAVLVVGAIGKIMAAGSSNGLTFARSIDLTPILGVSGILALVGLVACYLPARRATKIDPVVALQVE